MALRIPELWREADFRRLWAGQTVSEFGSTVTREAIPYAAVLALGATPAQMGLLAAAGSAPILLVGLFAGAWTDRRRRRPLMLGADLVRAALLASIPAAAALGLLRLSQLFVVTALVGGLSVLFNVAYAAYLPGLVRRERLMEANSALGLSGSLAEVSAPGIAGLLVQALTAPVAIAVDALTFLWSALTLARVKAPEPPPRPAIQPRLGEEMLEGLRATLGNPLLRAFALSAGTGALFGNFFATLYALYALRVLGLNAALLGLTVALGGAGEFFGAALTGPLARRFGVGRTILGASVVGSIVSLLIPLAAGPVALATAMLGAAQFVGDGTRAVAAIQTTTLQQRLPPDRLLGRVNATQRLIGEGLAPVGALAGGFLAAAIGVRPTVAIAVLGGACGLLWLFWSPVRRLGEGTSEGCRRLPRE